MNGNLKWEVIAKLDTSQPDSAKEEEIIRVLLQNRGIKTEKQKREFFEPTHPEDLEITRLGISKRELDKAIRRISAAIENGEGIIIYGDYDADGVCATAILWECLYSFSRNVKPYIPSRFEEGYGANPETISNLKSDTPDFKLLITVDNGIVAHKAIKKANRLGIDVIVADHHQKGKKLPDAYSILHTTHICGSGIAWILAREINKQLKKLKTRMLKKTSPSGKYQPPTTSLELCAIGTIADQMPLVGPNRSFVKYGLERLNNTQRAGLLALFEVAGLGSDQEKQRVSKIGTYEVNYIIAPRINAMGRMEHAIDSLRLLCTKDKNKASDLAKLLNRTNLQRQKVLEDVVLHARKSIERLEVGNVIVLAHETYHEGVIGLAASKLVEEFYRPSIVLSKGEKVSKASARSISGFNIIEVIRSLEGLIIGGGGHAMAAGFSIETEKIEEFKKRIEEVSRPLLTEDILAKKLKIDLEVDFVYLTQKLYNLLSKFEPTGIGNPTPTFMTRNINLIDARTVGSEARHLRLKLEKGNKVFDAIAFNMGEVYSKLSPDVPVDVVYSLSRNVWNGYENLELKVRDLRVSLRSGKNFEEE